MGSTPRNIQYGAIIARPPTGKLYALLTGILLAVVAGLLWIDTVAAYSVLLGGLISIAPNSYFARRAFQHRGARAVTQIARGFYQGEAGKFVMTATAFAVVFAAVKPLHMAAFWAAYLLATLGHMLSAAYFSGWRR